MGFYSNPVAGGSGQTVLAVSSQTANFTATANTLYQVNATTANVTVTLPTSTTSQSLIVKKTDVSVNTVILSGNINGSASTLTIYDQNQSKELYANGSGGWISIRGDLDPLTIGSSATAVGYLNAIGITKLTVGTTAPTSPTTGDIWVDTN